MKRLGLVAALSLALSGCAGLPIGHHSFIVVGVGLVRVDREAQAVGVSSRSLGLTAGCRSVTLGIQASYCAQIPLSADLAIIERGSGSNQHLEIPKLHPKENPR